jgi:hypothetical protein
MRFTKAPQAREGAWPGRQWPGRRRVTRRPRPGSPGGNPVATRMRRDYAQFTKAPQTAGLMAGMEWPGAAAVPQDAPAPAS